MNQKTWLTLSLIIILAGCTATGPSKTESKLKSNEGVGALEFRVGTTTLLPAGQEYVELVIRNNALGDDAKNIVVSLDNVAPFKIVECGGAYEPNTYRAQCPNNDYNPSTLDCETEGNPRSCPSGYSLKLVDGEYVCQSITGSSYADVMSGICRPHSSDPSYIGMIMDQFRNDPNLAQLALQHPNEQYFVQKCPENYQYVPVEEAGRIQFYCYTPSCGPDSTTCDSWCCSDKSSGVTCGESNSCVNIGGETISQSYYPWYDGITPCSENSYYCATDTLDASSVSQYTCDCRFYGSESSTALIISDDCPTNCACGFGSGRDQEVKITESSIEWCEGFYDMDPTVTYSQRAMNKLLADDELDVLWLLQAPIDVMINNLPYDHRISYSVNYDYSTSATQNVIALSQSEVQRKKRSGEQWKISGTSSESNSEVGIHPETSQPIIFPDSGNSPKYNYVFSVQNIGVGYIGKKQAIVVVTYPQELDLSEDGLEKYGWTKGVINADAFVQGQCIETKGGSLQECGNFLCEPGENFCSCSTDCSPVPEGSACCKATQYDTQMYACCDGNLFTASDAQGKECCGGRFVESAGSGETFICCDGNPRYVTSPDFICCGNNFVDLKDYYRTMIEPGCCGGRIVDLMTGVCEDGVYLRGGITLDSTILRWTPLISHTLFLDIHSLREVEYTGPITPPATPTLLSLTPSDPFYVQDDEGEEDPDLGVNIWSETDGKIATSCINQNGKPLSAVDKSGDGFFTGESTTKNYCPTSWTNHLISMYESGSEITSANLGDYSLSLISKGLTITSPAQNLGELVFVVNDYLELKAKNSEGTIKYYYPETTTTYSDYLSSPETVNWMLTNDYTPPSGYLHVDSIGIYFDTASAYSGVKAVHVLEGETGYVTFSSTSIDSCVATVCAQDENHCSIEGEEWCCSNTYESRTMVCGDEALSCKTAGSFCYEGEETCGSGVDKWCCDSGLGCGEAVNTCGPAEEPGNSLDQIAYDIGQEILNAPNCDGDVARTTLSEITYYTCSDVTTIISAGGDCDQTCSRDENGHRCYVGVDSRGYCSTSYCAPGLCNDGVCNPLELAGVTGIGCENWNCQDLLDNGFDDDWNGLTDGEDELAGGRAEAWGQESLCDGVDNEGDGMVDGMDGESISRACQDYTVGSCVSGEQQCVNAQWSVCDALTYEDCNGLDDDCNGLVDDATDFEMCGKGMICYLGKCEAVTSSCTCPEGSDLFSDKCISYGACTCQRQGVEMTTQLGTNSVSQIISPERLAGGRIFILPFTFGNATDPGSEMRSLQFNKIPQKTYTFNIKIYYTYVISGDTSVSVVPPNLI